MRVKSWRKCMASGGTPRAAVPDRACIMPVAAGEKFCVWCKCERCGAGRQQCHGRGRWCSVCSKQIMVTTGKRYANQHGTWALDKNWTESLQCTARAAFLTNLAPTRDTVAWRSFVDDQEVRWSARLSATTVAANDQRERCGHLTFTVIVAMLKWPSLVQVAVALLSEMGITPHTATATDWRNYIVAMLERADGHSTREELRGANPGRSACYSGLIWMARTLRVAQRLEAKKVPRRVTSKSPQSGRVFKLGAMQGQYALFPVCEGVQKLQEMMDAIGRTTLELRPKSVVGRGTLEDWIREINALSLSVCGRSSKYASGSLSRRLLSVFEYRYGETVWDMCSAAVLIGALPDLAGHMPETATSQAVEEIRKRFGMSILVISAMACLWQQVDSASRQAVLRASCLELLRAAEECGREHAQPQDWAPQLARS